MVPQLDTAGHSKLEVVDKLKELVLESYYLQCRKDIMTSLAM